MTNERMPNDKSKGGLAQLARASALHAEGQRFESVILHPVAKCTKVHIHTKIFDILKAIK